MVVRIRVNAYNPASKVLVTDKLLVSDYLVFSVFPPHLSKASNMANLGISARMLLR